MPAKSTPKPTRPETVKKGHKWCPRCGEVKVHDLFARNRASKDGLFSICKECEKPDRIKAKERRAAAAAEAARAAQPTPQSTMSEKKNPQPPPKPQTPNPMKKVHSTTPCSA